MADHFYGITVPGAHLDGATRSVTKGTSTNSATVELRVHDGVTGLNKEQVLLALEAIEAFIITDIAPA